MLQYRTIYPGTLELLIKLMQIPVLQDFYLVGGTALALQLGHRISIDLDLFSTNDFDEKKVFEEINYEFTIKDSILKPNTLNLQIEFPTNSQQLIKIDIIKYSYKLLKPINIIDNIRLLSIEDISAMKLSALANRGLKKDFYDIYYLLKSFSINQLIEFFQQKYKVYNTFHLIKSLTYFEDAENEPEPIIFDEISWTQIKSFFLTETKKLKF